VAVFGLGIGLTFSPLANVAMAGLDHASAGAGSGAFNTARQVGSVIGSAVIVAAFTGRLTAHLPAGAVAQVSGAVPQQVPPQVFDAFATASGQAIVVPAVVMLVGAAAALAMRALRPHHTGA